MKSLEFVALLLCIVTPEVFGTIGDIKTDRIDLFPAFSPTCGYRDRDFILLTRALSNGLNFFTENVNTLVLDAGVGTTIIERQIGLILDSNLKFSEQVTSILKMLMDRASGISGNIVQARMVDDMDEHQKNISLPWITTESLWRTPKIGNWNRLNQDKSTSSITLRNLFLAAEVLNEESSDSCMGELFEGCSVSDECRNLFLGKPTAKYSLTHQVIYYHIAEQICVGNPGFPLRSSGDLKRRLRALCSRIYTEATAIDKEDFPARFQDLFAEQIVVCSIAGYQDFLRPDWMYELLFWQKELTNDLACFLDHSHEEYSNLERKRRSDISIDFDAKVKCSVHFSALGLAALTMHLRHFLETCT